MKIGPSQNEENVYGKFEWHIFKDGRISANRQNIQILRVLSFLQLLKFKKAKYLYLSDCQPFGWDMVVFQKLVQNFLVLNRTFWISKRVNYIKYLLRALNCPQPECSKFFECQFQDEEFEIIRKFPCYCNECEHESKAYLMIEEASMKKRSDL